MATAAKIDIKLDAQTAALKKGLAESRQSIDRLGKGMSGNVAMGMAKFQAGLIAVQAVLGAVSGAMHGVVEAMRDMDRTQKVADRLGITADALNVLGFAAEQSGASQDQLNTALTQLSNRVSDAAQGIGDGKKALDDLGLSAEAINNLTVDQQLSIIADAMQGVENHSDKVRIAMDLFGRSGTELLNMLEGGSAGLNDFAAQADDLGLTLGDSREEVEAANDAINRMKRAWGALVDKIVVAIAPAIELIATALAKVVGWFNQLFGLGGDVKFDSLAKAGDKVKASMEGTHEAVKKTVEKVHEATKKTVDMARELGKIQRMKTSGVGAVTRSSAAGFSAVQQGIRDRADTKRWRAAMLKKQDEIVAAAKAGQIILAEGSI